MLQQSPNNSSFHHHGRDNDLLQQQSNKYRKINDQLSSVLSEYQDLRPPNIVVIGEQSAGKSSVLEYLSGIRFVTGQNMVTKCPLQLRMVNSKSSSGSKAVIKSNIYLTKHSNKPITIENPEINDGAQQLEEAIQHLTSLHLQEEGYTGDVSRVSTHLIEVEITSPNVPDLTLIDLPGLITTSNEKNPTLKDDIRQLVKRNTTDRDCILIVGDAGRDLQTIVGFEEAREKDPSQKRTLCALTRVDKHVNDIETLNKMIESLNNRGPIKLVHGYVGLRNR
ncbi:hypothetical protein C9374_013255 [Naegleria lovaniensis]|uniref:Dynamin-type G domain-containing protein n=1 Tax=Naegleria lovaniensis TaxID=51637 RepID=A0AA88GYX6_NAELO|nr:uncharacterized protein C9374_013255 [Naegleria lovaniensis]KAG2391770.1 hypothetical protein C9374_013255 [Naegleria lovaniensis]